jgi:hypothetical protein
MGRRRKMGPPLLPLVLVVRKTMRLTITMACSRLSRLHNQYSLPDLYYYYSRERERESSSSSSSNVYTLHFFSLVFQVLLW